MSTDDFEARLRERLADLAEHDDDWADPLPAARRRGSAPDPDDVGDVRVLPAPRRRRWGTNLAVAAVALAIVAGGGLGVRALVHGSSSESGAAGSAGGAAVGVPEDPSGLPSLAPGGGTAETGGATNGGSGGAGCTAATSTGPLADVATIRPSGIVGPRTTSGTPVAVPYQLTFGRSAGTAQVRPAQVVRVENGQVCAPGGVSAGVVEAVPVAPGAGTSGSATFAATDAAGTPLAAGDYQVAIVIRYTVDGSGEAQLVSTPVTVTVS